MIFETNPQTARNFSAKTTDTRLNHYRGANECSKYSI